MNARLHALIVPALIAAVSLAYWVQIAGARRSVVLVPEGILLFMGICMAIVVVQDMLSPPEPPQFNRSQLFPPLALVGLCIGYYFAFTEIGFDAANLVFVGGAALLMKMSLPKAVTAAVITTATLALLAYVMDFRLPDPFWAR